MEGYSMLTGWQGNILQMSSLSTLMSLFKATWIKFPASFSGHWQTYFKIYQEKQKVNSRKTVLKKRE